MNYPQAEELRTIDAPPELMAELVTTSVSRLGWRIKFVNAKLRQLSAFENKTERYSRLIWRYEFDCIVKWRKGIWGVEISVSINDRERQATSDECQARCVQILDAIEQDAEECLEVDGTTEASKSYGSANWCTSDELEKHGYLDGKQDHRRLILGLAPDGSSRYASVPPQETAMHATVCGPTGCGKSSTAYIPNLIERTGLSAIVTEATAGNEPPDLFYKTAGFRQLAGQKIYKFNPDDPTSHRINPLQYVRTYDQAAHVANLVIENTSSKYTADAKIWENGERQLLTVLIVHAVADGADLGTIRRWLRKGPDGLGMILMNSPMVEAREEFWGFYSSSSEGFRNGVICGLMQRLNLWVNPRIVALTETTDLDVKALPEELFSFYLSVPAQKTHLKPLAALVFNFVLNLALEHDLKHPLGLFLDEFTNFGYIPGIAEKLTLIRHRQIPAMLGFQDFVQLRKVYGDEDAALLFGQPGTKIFFRPREITTARKISESLGNQTIVDRRVSSSGHIQEREFGRPLMNPGEVMALQKGYAIAFTPATNPILLKTFTWQQYKDAISYPPPEFRKLDVNEELVRMCSETGTKPDWHKKYDEQVNSKRTRRARPKGDPKVEREPKWEADEPAPANNKHAESDRYRREQEQERQGREPDHSRDNQPEF
jgi:type IV secretory pathway TraG/TraD family ATPase VirD4